MSRTSALARGTSLVLVMLGMACSSEGQRPAAGSGGGEGPSAGGALAAGGSGSGGWTGAGGSLGGAAGSPATGGTTGGDGGSADPGTGGDGGRGGATGGGGLPGDASAGGSAGVDAGRDRGSSGGAISTGGAGFGGARGGAGGSGMGGSVGPDAAPKDGAGKDAGLSEDTFVPDAYLIPDLSNRQDTAGAFWTTTYKTNCTPPAYNNRAQSDGHHRAGENCMTSGCHLNPRRAEHHAGTDCRGSGCHANGSPDGSGAPAFLYGGTVYHAGTLTAEASAEIGVLASDGFYLACSASNGNFWYMAPSGKTSLPWTGATTRLRNANGQAPMMTAPAAGCNASACHTKTLKITAP